MSKKIKALALMLAVAIVLSMVPVNNVQAATTKQSSLKANESKKCILSNTYDKIWFEFTAPADGFFNVTLSKETPSDSGDFTVKIVDSQGTKEFSSTYGGAFSTPFYGSKGGQKYYITLEGRKNVYVNVKLNWSNSSCWENEPNDNQSGAKPMAANTTYYGVPSSDDNGDYFFVKAPQNGYFVFGIAHNDVTQSGRFEVAVYESGSSQITEMSTTNGNTIKIGVKAGTLLYVRVRNNYGSSRHQVYKLTPYFTASETFETEPNNSASQAKTIAFNQTYNGSIGNWSNSDNDGDFYKFSVNSISQVTINFGPVDIAKTGNWKVVLVNSKGKTADVLRTDSNKTAKVKLSKGVYYIRIVNSYNAGNKEYQLKVSAKDLKFKSKRPVIKSASVKKYNGFFNNKKFVGCSLSKTVAGADGYEVSVASTKTMKKPFVKDRIKATGKKIKTEKYFKASQKSFYVQVKPYFTDPFGTIVYGKKSVVKKTTTKAK